MTIYADVLVIVNLYVDFLLLCCVQGFLKLPATGRRLVLGALCGAVSSLVGLCPMPGWAQAVTGGLSALAAAAAAFAPMRPRLLFRSWLCTWAFSFLLAGFLLFAAQFAPAGSIALVGGAVYLKVSVPALFGATCAAYGVFWLFRRFLPRENSCPPMKLTISNRGSKAEVFAKADTGSALREPFSGLPVVVCQADAIADIAPPEALIYPNTPEPDVHAALRLVPFESLGGKGLLPAFRPQQVCAPSGQLLDCYIAVTRSRLSAGSFAALYNPDLFPDLGG